jgi:hypothetical protein
MRAMTPEVLVASGAYIDYLNGQPNGARERWTIHALGGSRITRAERNAFGLMVRVEATETGGKLVSFTVELENPDSPTVRHAIAYYRVDAGRLHVERRVNNKQLVEQEVPLDEDSVIAPLLRVFMGHIVLEVSRQGAPVPVIVPHLHNPHDAEHILLCDIEMRAATACAAPTEPAVQPDLTCFEYTAPLGDVPIHCWLNADGLLARTVYRQGDDRVWTTTLDDYQTFSVASASSN